MTALDTTAGSGIFLVAIGTAALRSIILASVAGVLLWALRVKASSTRLLTWTAVLYASLAMPLLGTILPSVPVPIPTWQQRSTGKSVEPDVAYSKSSEQRFPLQHSQRTSPTQASRKAGINAQVQNPARVSRDLTSGPFALVCYVAVAFLLLGRVVAGLALSMRLVKASWRIQDPRISSILSRVAGAGDCHFAEVRESSAISVPVTVGPIRAAVLLPLAWREWDDRRLEAVMAHELSHVRRHDAFTQFAALLHRAIFWFSPLAWWLNRHIADLAEQVSDEAALTAGAERNQYARTLLGFFETLQASPRRVWWQGVSMANPGKAEKRLEKILSWRGAINMGKKRSAAILILASAVPLVFLAASARPVPQAQTSPQPTTQNEIAPAPAGTHLEPPPQSSAPVSPSLPPAPEAGVVTSGPEPVAPAAPAIPTAPVGPVGGPVGAGPVAFQTHSNHRGYWYSYGDDDEQRFVIVTGSTDAFTMSGSSEDARHVEKLRKQIPGDFIWFQRDEKSYIIRDQATIDRARKLWAPQEELGKKQEELGRQQEALGKQQEELGAKMRQVKVNVPDMTAELDRLKAKLQKLGPTATMEQVGELQSEIGELQSKIGELQSHAGDEQGKLGEQMGALGEKQGKLGEQQGELGRQQAELAEKATRQMKELLDEAIKNGTAKPEPGEGSASL